uniref:Putative secreted metalloprotease n=1 Tax=Ornithodoros turicata TaxID=34597 RepID=A0A2R5L480_9ACAR
MLRCGLLALWCFAYVEAAARVAPTLVYPRLLEGRSSDGQKLLRINDDLTLSLERTSVFSNPLTLTTQEGNELKDVHVDVRRIEENLYHDPDTMSAVIMERSDTGVHVEGILRGNLRLEPSLASARSADGQVAHALYEIEEPMHDNYADALRIVEARSLKIQPRDADDADDVKPTFFQYPSIIYPKLFVVTDNAHSRSLKYSKLVSYMAIFYASVNLRFKDLEDPEVQFRVGSVNQLSTDDTKVLAMVSNGGKSYLSFTSTVENFKEYHKTHKQEGDIAILMTGLDIVASTKENEWLTSVAGAAFVGGLCTENNNYAVVEDKAPNYSGVYNVAHELAHLLGAPHDGTGGATDCSSEDGHIMGVNKEGPNHYNFSACSEETMMMHLLEADTDCLTSMSETSDYIPLAEQLPGEVLTLDQYCTDLYEEYPFGLMRVDDGDPSCKMYCCRKPSTGCMRSTAPDGASCGSTQGHVCINGVCGNREELMKHKKKEEETGSLVN